MRWGRVTAGNANLIIQNKRRWETEFVSSYIEKQNKAFVWDLRNWYMRSVAEPWGTRFTADIRILLKRLRKMRSNF